MVTIDNWVVPLARHFRDPLLSAGRLLALRQLGMTPIIREEREIFALAALMPITSEGVVFAGLWVAEGFGHETGVIIATRAIQLSHRCGLMVIVPSVLLPYVNHEAKTPKEAGRSLDQILSEMNNAGVPRKHAIRHGGLKVIPAPVCAKNPGSISPERHHNEL